MKPEPLLALVAQLTQQAGERILPFFQKHSSPRLKLDNSPVTDADLASHHFLVDALGKLNRPAHIISEEFVEQIAPGSSVTEYWLIDPLDGTKEFLKGKPEFTVNVALMRQGRPFLSVVHAPALGLTYLGQIGQGAWRQEAQAEPAPIRTRQADLAHLTVVASKDHSGPRVRRMLEQFSAPVLTSIGSSLKFCLVAEGAADLYFRDVPTMEWDTAAAQCVLEAAGGSVLDLTGQTLPYGKPGLKNGAFVAVGDQNFPWHKLAPQRGNANSFQAFFDTLAVPEDR